MAGQGRMVLLSDAVDEYLGMRKAKARGERGAACESSYLRRFLEQVGNIRLVNVDDRHVQRFFYEPDGTRPAFSSMAPSTFNQCRGVMVGFFNWCKFRGYLRTDKITRYNVPALRPARRPKVWLSPRQMLAALDVAYDGTDGHPRDRAVVALALNTGFRATEIVNLKISDVDLAAGAINVRVAKGGKRDVMPVTADLDGELRSWLEWFTRWAGDLHSRSCSSVARVRSCRPKHHGEPLCPDWFLVPAKRAPGVQRGGARMSLAECNLRPESRMTSVGAVADRVLGGIGVKDFDGRRVVDGRQAGMHTFRRSAAKAMFDMALADERSRDQALLVVKEFLHHSDIATTQVYLDMSEHREIRDRMLLGRSFITSLVDSGNVTSLGERMVR